MNNLVHADMPIEERMACDKVEKYFENWYYNLDRKSENFCFKYGLDWKNTKGNNKKHIKKIRTSILCTPDYICYDSVKDEFFFVEVKKCGYYFSLKQEQFKYYKQWQNNYPVRFWIYNEYMVNQTHTIKKIAYISTDLLDELINTNNYKETTWSKERKDPNDCKKLMWKIPFKDIYESLQSL